MGGQEQTKSYEYTCDHVGCTIVSFGPLDVVENFMNWLFLSLDGNGVPATCYCEEHRSLYE